MELTGKVALVTGGAQGIGRAVAVTLARNGADVAVSDINGEMARATAREIEKMGRRALAVEANVARFDDGERMVRETVEGLGRIDILVNNAGVARDKLVLRMSEEDWDVVLGVNLKGAFNCSRAALRYMSKQKSGRIVNIASVVGLMGNAGQANYAASKAGLIGFTKTLAREFGSRGITVNAIAPGYIDTPMTQALPEKVKEDLKRLIPLDRLGSPDDVARAVLFLVTGGSDYVTGQVLQVDGGLYM
ncbi:MAG: 3-oxoacyl-[acyl-carrier-protein] reductase [Deltaproteobacteria bacterium]|nr:3-oxoacyl-[acyl-carrier-protein] reductase [Deltaproteobacteria bacterium]MBW2122714.1 3-oxoacyl-[acyl-carrier-protein] reductase [Deltaproteobacteria bacterium]